MTTWQNLLARPSTYWLLCATFNGWIYFCNVTWTEKRVSRIHSTWFAESNMTKIIALMFTTLQCFVASLQAHVISIGIGTTFRHGTADIFAFVSFAWFHGIADLFAGVILILNLLFCRHQFLLQLARIVHCVAWDFAFVFLTNAWLQNFLFTSLAAVCMTFLFALMYTTRKELFTFMVTSWNWVSAWSSLSSDQRLNSVVATWAVP